MNDLHVLEKTNMIYIFSPHEGHIKNYDYSPFLYLNLVNFGGMAL